MKTKSYFLPSERYEYDFGRCSLANGWAQVDTGQDAPYFGTWANPETLEILCYCEGDVTEQKADTPVEFASEMLRIRDWADEIAGGFKGIDPGLSPNRIKDRFEELGLGDLLH